MNQIKDFYHKVNPNTITRGEEYYSLESDLVGIGINLNIQEPDFSLQQSQDHNGTNITPLKIGDIVIHKNKIKHAKIISSLPKVPIQAGPKYIVLRERNDLHKNSPQLPAWAIVIATQHNAHLWTKTSSYTPKLDPQKVLEYRFEEIPKPNPAGTNLLEHAENLLNLKEKASQTIENFHRAIAYRMLKNLPFSGKLQNTP